MEGAPTAELLHELSRRGGTTSGYDIWTYGGYTNLGQPLFAEVVVFLFVTSVAVLFEVGHHLMHNYLHAKTYKFEVVARFGQKQYHPTPRAKHHLIGGQQHVIALYDRISGELMVLGFVAFFVWVCYQSQVFHEIASDLKGRYTSSPDYYFLYNECHDVHIWLFLSMVSHFIVSMVCITLISKKQRRLAGYERGEADGHDDALARYQSLRKLFIEHYKEEKKEGIDDKFNFALYLALNLDRILADFYKFHISSWVLVLVIKAIECMTLGIMAAEAYWHWYDKLIISLAVSMLSPAVLTWAVFTGRSNDKKAMKNGHFPKQAGMCGLGESYDVEMWLTRLYQSLAFTLSYELMRQIANKELWHHSDIDDWPMSNFFGTFISISTVLVLWLINIWLLPKGIMSTAVKYAMPPYVDQENMDLLDAVIAVGVGGVSYCPDMDPTRRGRNRMTQLEGELGAIGIDAEVKEENDLTDNPTQHQAIGVDLEMKGVDTYDEQY